MARPYWSMLVQSRTQRNLFSAESIWIWLKEEAAPFQTKFLKWLWKYQGRSQLSTSLESRATKPKPNQPPCSQDLPLAIYMCMIVYVYNICNCRKWESSSKGWGVPGSSFRPLSAQNGLLYHPFIWLPEALAFHSQVANGPMTLAGCSKDDTL